MQLTPERAAAWEAEGRRLAAGLDSVAAAVVAGHDLEAAAHLALGIAAAQSSRRRVALGDLSGRAEPLQRLLASQVSDEDPHGLGDVFAYGISLTSTGILLPRTSANTRVPVAACSRAR